LTIDGSGQAITVDALSSNQIFSVNSGATLNLRNLTITDGFGADGGGADNAGTLTVTNCTFSDNLASFGRGIASVSNVRHQAVIDPFGAEPLPFVPDSPFVSTKCRSSKRQRERVDEHIYAR